MKRLFIGAIAASVGLWACRGDPTASLRGGPADLHLSAYILFLPLGSQRNVDVVVTDVQQNPLAVTGVTATGTTPQFFTVAADPLPPTNNARHTFRVSSVALGPGTINFSAAGLAATMDVVVVPIAFDGAMSSLTPRGGDTLVLRATSDLSFSPSDVTVTFADDESAIILGVDVDTVALLVPYANPEPVVIEGIRLNYRPSVVTTLPTAEVVSQIGDFWAGDDDVTTAPPIPVPGAGDTIYVVTTMAGAPDNLLSCAEEPFGSTGPCLIYQFTLAQDTELSIVVDWTGTADLDFYLCPDATLDNCFEEGGGGATANHPEEVESVLYAAGTHYLYVEKFGDVTDPSPRNITITISQP